MPEGPSCPTPLSNVTDVALLALQVSVVDDPRTIVVGCAVTVNVGGPCGAGEFDFPPEHATRLAANSTGAACLTTLIRAQLAVREAGCEISIEMAKSPQRNAAHYGCQGLEGWL